MAARGSVVNLVAMVSGAALTLALTVLVSRWLQPAGAGAFFELIALFTIASNTFELGADTGLMRWISRARAVGGITQVRKLVPLALWPVAIIGAGAAAAIWVMAPDLARIFLHGLPPGRAAVDVRIIAPMVPLAALSACLIDASRGFGRTWPYLAVEGLGKPLARIALVLGALVAGFGLHGSVFAWGIPVAVGLLFAWFTFAGIVRSETHAVSPPSTGKRRGSQRGPLRLRGRGRTVEGYGRHRSPPLERGKRLGIEFWRFTAPRACQGIFQVTIIWLDILLVGALISRHAAGVYAAVSKLAMVGTFALEGTRLAISPQISAMLARQAHRRAAGLYQEATRWLMLASWPVYLVFAMFPAVLLGIFGSRYATGAATLAVLSLAMLVNLATGNVTAVLLMGGKSSWGAINTGTALVINIGLNLLLLPHLGILGAAIAWAASIIVDNVAALIEVRWVLGLSVIGPGYGLVVAMTAGCFGLTGLAARALLGQTIAALAATLAVGLPAYVVILYAARQRLQLAGMIAAFRLRGAPQTESNPGPPPGRIEGYGVEHDGQASQESCEPSAARESQAGSAALWRGDRRTAGRP